MQQSHLGCENSGQKGFLQAQGYLQQYPFGSQQMRKRELPSLALLSQQTIGSQFMHSLDPPEHPQPQSQFSQQQPQSSFEQFISSGAGACSQPQDL
ncbi:MAG: hypothetical protein RR977_00535 [Oscillospiraceae bacterium]